MQQANPSDAIPRRRRQQYKQKNGNDQKSDQYDGARHVSIPGKR